MTLALHVVLSQRLTANSMEASLLSEPIGPWWHLPALERQLLILHHAA